MVSFLRRYSEGLFVASTQRLIHNASLTEAQIWTLRCVLRRWRTPGEVTFLFTQECCLLLADRPSNMLAYLTDGSARTVVRTASPKQKLQIFSDFCKYCLTETEAADQTCSLALSRYIDFSPASPSADLRQALGQVVSREPVFNLLVQPDRGH